MELDVDRLHLGDNLDILRRCVPDESVDLVYLDPPFKSNRAYHLIFRDESGRTSDAQQLAFDDSWHWGPTAEAHYLSLAVPGGGSNAPQRLSVLVASLVDAIGRTELTAYLVEMAVRLVELRRVLKPTGSLWLHCDPTASHYLKVMLDSIFGPLQFRSEVVWKRTSAHSGARRPGPVHDILFFYTKGRTHTWNVGYHALDPTKKQHHARGADARGEWFTQDLTGAGRTKGETGQPWRGFDPNTLGRHWRTLPSELDKLDADGRIYWSKESGRWPKLRVYADGPAKGSRLQDVWTDIAPINMSAKERLGYPTQKPLQLLDRIIRAASNPGDIVLDPFCGCGTAIEAAIAAGRHWVGIDVSDQAYRVINQRFRKLYAQPVPLGHIAPKDIATARTLATSKPHGRRDFQAWANTLVGARSNPGKDRGVDGLIPFVSRRGRINRALVSVKSGKVKPGDVRDLKGAVARERAAVGVLVTLEEPSEEMRLEATTAGFYEPRVPRLQIITVAQALAGARPRLPRYQQQELFEEVPDADGAGPSVAEQVGRLEDQIAEARRSRRRRQEQRLERIRESVRRVLEEEEITDADSAATVRELAGAAERLAGETPQRRT